MADIEYAGTGNDDGCNFGRSDGKIGFYGLAAPIVKQTITVQASLTAGTVHTALLADVSAIIAALAALGLVTQA